MMTATNQRRISARFARVAVFGLLALAAALCPTGEARAQWTTSGNNTTTTNNVGVGTATPSQMFHVHSIGTWAGTRVTTAATGTTINDGVHFGYDDQYGAYIWNRESTSVVFATSNAERMRIGPTGNVGIGTATPGVVNGVSANAPYMPLHIQGQGANPASVVVNSASPFSGFVINDSSQPADSRMWSISQAAGGGKLTFRAYSDSGSVASDKVVIDRSGNVGIGTNAPGSKLVVSGNAAAPLAPQDGTVFQLVGADALKTRVSIDSFGSTAGPSVTFRSARGTGAAPTATQTGDAIGIVYGTGFGATQFLTAPKPAMWMVATENWSDTAAGSAIFFNTVKNGTAAPVERMRINDAGNVGIGTTNPTTRLHVDGDLTVDGNISAKYQDVAEWVPSTQKLSAGTVVILDPERTNQVLASATSYDTSVAGVVSAQPGIRLGESGEGKVLVATTGRVKVRVDATRAPIKIGDLIVTSDVAGTAMRSEPMTMGGRKFHSPGTIIGKALEPLAGGTGEILVLLSLQ